MQRHTVRRGGSMSDREKNKCYNLIPVYYGDRPVATRGEPNSNGDWYFECFMGEYRWDNTISGLCDKCKRYLHLKKLTKEQIKEKYYNNKDSEVLVVNKTSWYFKKI